MPCRFSLIKELSLVASLILCFQTHSEVPLKDEDWPSQRSVLEFQDKVRARLIRLYDDIDARRITLTHKIGRVLFITLEHEAMHAETLLYMLLQRAGSGTIPPPGFRTPNWPSLAIAWNETAYPETDTVTLGPATVVLGHDDNEDWDAAPKDDTESHEFGWDNEHPKRAVHVREFRIEWRPVTNGEFYRYYNGAGKNRVRLPASWVEDDEGIKVRVPSDRLRVLESESFQFTQIGANTVWASFDGCCPKLASYRTV